MYIFFDTFILFWYFLIRISCYLLVFAHTMCWVKLFLIRFDAFWYVLIFSDTFFDTFFDTCIFWYIFVIRGCFWYFLIRNVCFWYATCVFDTRHSAHIILIGFCCNILWIWRKVENQNSIYFIVELRHPIGVHEDFDETSGGYSEGVHENFHNCLLVCWFGSLEQTWPGLEPNLLNRSSSCGIVGV